MAKCEECNKKLGLLEGYRHPLKGKKYTVCSPCFDVANMQVTMNRIEAFREVNGIDDTELGYFSNIEEFANQSNGLDMRLSPGV